MIELSGLSVKSNDGVTGDIAMTVTGLRPGEKLYEELLIGNSPSPTRHPLIMKAHEPTSPCAELEAALRQLEQAVEDNLSLRVIEVLSRIIPEFQHADEDVTFSSPSTGKRTEPLCLA
jgi:FlaA1/EpsC-like NDP-sugar epimerase